ncbi:hypothetical protein PSP31121_05314 [Pandoraea sputorum]|uniref:Uncharacterized protein n=1 Tax=Pandoraea sputorum TaxID=93222 RepID=A0A5E5BKM4_9BURK|nr:hypothetical protein PSP31121_05314 [Pandoraea sputorum]
MCFSTSPKHGGLPPVVPNLARHAPQVLEGFPVASQYRMQILVLDEAAPKIAAMPEYDRA